MSSSNGLGLLFDDAVAVLRSLGEVGKGTISNDTLLQLYSLFKQATVGNYDRNATPPSKFLAPVKFYKHHAWANLAGTPKPEATERYVDLAIDIIFAFDETYVQALPEKTRDLVVAFKKKVTKVKSSASLQNDADQENEVHTALESRTTEAMIDGAEESKGIVFVSKVDTNGALKVSKSPARVPVSRPVSAPAVQTRYAEKLKELQRIQVENREKLSKLQDILSKQALQVPHTPISLSAQKSSTSAAIVSSTAASAPHPVDLYEFAEKVNQLVDSFETRMATIETRLNNAALGSSTRKPSRSFIPRFFRTLIVLIWHLGLPLSALLFLFIKFLKARRILIPEHFLPKALIQFFTL